MDVSVIIVSWNVKPLLQKCLKSIFDFTTDIDFEVIVIDNASEDASIQMVAQEFPLVDLIASNQNLGFAKANNLGLEHASGNYILFMNPDMELVENSFKTMIDLMANDNQIGLATCQLNYPDNTRQNNIKNNPRLCDQILILLKLHHIFKPKCLQKYLARDFDYFKQQEVKQIMGAFVMTENDLIRKIGGWDADYFIWWEDLDLCKKVQNENKKIIYTPSTKIIHHEGKSFIQQKSLAKQKRFNKGMRTYFKKHHGMLSYLIISILSPISLLLAWLSQTFKIKPKAQSKI
jgi:GT2 family glycosyltransferase